MKQVYTEQVLIRVWRNLKMLRKVPTSHFGHASVTVNGMSVKTTDFEQPHTQQISFWPGGSGASFFNAFSDLPSAVTSEPFEDRLNEMNKLTAIRLEVGYCKGHGIAYPPEWDQALREARKSPLADARPGQKRLTDPLTNKAVTNEAATYTLRDGTKILVPLYSQSPQAKFYVPGLRAKDKRWGLNTTRMADWWIEFQKDNPTYRAFSPDSNCVGIVFHALREGGADGIAPIPEVRKYAEPVQVEEYAAQLIAAMNNLEWVALGLDAGIQRDFPALKPVPSGQLMDGIWMSEFWKEASALGALYHRGPIIQEIDRDLEAFQRLTWKFAFPEKYALFIRIFRNVARHRAEKSSSKRSEAVAQLGSQLFKVLSGWRFYDGYRPTA